MTEQITPEVTKFKAEVASVSEEVKESVRQLKISKSEATVAIDEVRRLSDFHLLLTKALNDDRVSFDEIYRIATKENHEFQKTAEQAVFQIIEGQQASKIFQFSAKWKEQYNLDPVNASLAEFAKVYSKCIPMHRSSLIKTIWEQERFAKAERLDMLYQVITSADSIKLLNQACRLMDEEAKIGKNFVGYKKYIEWWDENRENNDSLGEVE
jgi:hypothetical protein